MNCKLLKFCWIPVLLFFFNSSLLAQKSEQAVIDSTAAPVEDSTSNDAENTADTVIVKTVFNNSGDSILTWKHAREFGYMSYLDSMLKKKTDLRIDTVSIDNGSVNRGRTTGSSTTSPGSVSILDSSGIKIFFWAVAIFFVGFILYKLFITGGLFTTGNAKVVEEPVSKEPEILNEVSEYDALIHEAESKKDFNLAIRYSYLQSLKKLVDGELISFSPDKTNNLYVQELTGRTYQHDFAYLTFNYEYVWYGRFMINMIRYQKLKEEFISFNKKI